MNMKNIARALLVAGLASFAHAKSIGDPMKVIDQGRLVLSDGSSIYIFNKDKTFVSGPLGLSGQTIKGKWKHDRDGFRITGTWGWMNGWAKQEEQTMLMYIGWVSEEEEEVKVVFNGDKNGNLKIRKGYFLIRSLNR